MNSSGPSDTSIRLTVEVVSPTGYRWSGPAQLCVLPTVDGDLGILVDHTPVVTLLRDGEVRVTDAAGNQQVISITGGSFFFDRNHATVLADDVDVPLRS